MPHTATTLTRIGSLFMSFAFGVIGMGVGINALVKFHDEKRQLEGAVPAGATVTVDTNDILDAGYVLTVVCGLVALFSLLFLAPIFLAPALAGRTLRFQGAILAFLSVWLFATLIPFTDFFANRSAKVTAFIGSIPISPEVIQQVVASLGASTQYRHVHYLLLPAVLHWFTFLFATTSAVLSFLDTRSARKVNTYPVSSAGIDREEVSEKDKARIAQEDV
ncbi:hypothetical protein PsYK624_085590 [Phanerochaete sordida]|uniref:Uncharacterized protein n=1 Tax=Phanerochaete sordida TaxID=48140 RepID=A0A9P3GCX3_9APHY|nr:hypothetical protein PsYK624_085590 [Phanerochaete sordida]